MENNSIHALRARLLTARDANPEQLILAKETIGADASDIVQLLDETFDKGRIQLKKDDSHGDITISAIDTDQNTFVVQGMAVDALYDIEKAKVVCTFGVRDDAAITLCIKITPATTWRFSTSFFNLADTYFDSLQVASPMFIVSSNQYYDSELQVDVTKGVSFYTHVSLNGQASNTTGHFLQSSLKQLIDVVMPDAPPFYGPLIEDSNSRHLEIAMDFSDFDLNIAGLPALKLPNTQFVLSNDYSVAPAYNITDLIVQSEVEFGGITLPLALHLPQGLSGWRLSLMAGRRVPLTDLAAFLGVFTGIDLLTALPDDLKGLRELALTHFSVAFDLESQGFTSLALQITSCSDPATQPSTPVWPIIPGAFELDDITLTLEVSASEQQFPVRGSIIGTFHIGGLPLTATIFLPLGTGNWTLTSQPVLALPDLGALAQLLGGADLRALLPGGMGKVGGLTLTSVALEIDPKTPRLVNFAFELYATDEWPLIDKRLVIRDVGIAINVNQPLTTRAITGSVSGTISIGDVDVDVSVHRDSAQEDWALTVHADEIPLPSLQELDVLAGTGVAGLFPEKFATGRFTLYDLNLAVNLSRKQIEQVGVRIGTEDTWELIPDIFSVRDIDAGLHLDWSSGSLAASGDISGVLTIAQTDIYVSASRFEDGSWFVSGALGADEPINLTALIAHAMHMDVEQLPPLVPEVALHDLFVSADTGSHTYSFHGEVDIDWSSNSSIGDLPIPAFRAIVEIESTLETDVLVPQGTPKRVYSGFLEGQVQFTDDLALVVRYDFAPYNKSLTLEFEGYSCTISKVQSDTIVSVHLGDLSLGDLVRFVARQVDPEADITLESPWDLLNDINLKHLSLQINVTQGSGGVWYDANIDLGFATIQSVGLFYQKATQDSQKKSLQFKIAGQFLAMSYSKDAPLQWDALNGEKPPAVKGEGGGLFELRYFGIGRHVSFKDHGDITTVYDALDKLGNAFRPLPPGRSETTKPVASARSTPIDALDALQFNPDSNWLIGFDFTLLDTLTLGGVFNDPELYGLYIGLQGEKAKVFAGLSVQILYKKVTDTLGEYYLQLKLPTAMRQLEFGAVSVTLPIIDISIFTNGNFRIDCGFPHNGDYSRSGAIQAFPFTGTGGFYFGLLNGETSRTVPRITNGTFSPVLEFGFGLQLGVGKSIDKGFLSARFMVVVEGVLEGTLAFFHPYDSAVPAENYYRVVGRVRIVGQVSGSIDFTVISASVNIMVYASAAIALESYQPIQLYVEAGVSVALSIKILFFEVHFSFSATISESFTIGSVGTPPWQIDQHQPAPEPLPDALSFTAFSLEPEALPGRPEGADLQPVHTPGQLDQHWPAPGPLREAPSFTAFSPESEALPGRPDETNLQPVHQAPLQSWQWGTITCWATPQEVALFFTPALTIVERTPHIVALLLIHHPPGGQADDAFVSLCRGMLAWALSAYLSVQDTTALRQRLINAADLQMMYHRLTGTVPPDALRRIPGLEQTASTVWEELKARGWLLDNGAISAQFQRLGVDASLDLSAEFAAAATAVKDLLHEWPRPFGYQNLRDFLAANYVFTVQARPTELPQNDENVSALQAGILPMVPELRMQYTGQDKAIDFGRSLACDQDYLAHVKTYLNLLTGTAEQRATSSIADSKQTVSEFVFRDYFTLVLQAVVQHSRDLLQRYPVTLQASDRLADIAGRYDGVTVASLALANQFDSSAWQQSAVLWVHGVHHEVAAGETLSDVAETRNQGFSSLDLATTNQYLPDMFQAAQTISIAQLDYTVPRAATLGEIATRYSTQVEQIVVQDTTVQQGEGPTGPVSDRLPTPLSTLQISGIQFRVDAAHDTVDQVAAWFLLSPEAIQAANPTVDFTPSTLPQGTVLAIPALRYVVPPQTRQEIAQWFGVRLEDITAADGGAVEDQADVPLSVNSRWTIRNVQYTISSGDTLAGMANRLGVTAATLLTANPALQLTRGVRVQLPDFCHAVQSGETLNSIATLYDLPVEEFAEHNRTTTGLFTAQATWVAPHVTMSVADLLDTLQQRAHIAALHNVASTASRFLLHGLRLPVMGQTFPDDPKNWAQLTTQALYQLTQQQFAAPAWLYTPAPLDSGQPTDVFTMTLLNPNGLPWLNVEHSALSLIDSERQQLTQMASAVAQLDMAQPQELPLYRPVKRSFSLQQSIVWHNAPPVPYAYAQGPEPQAGGPVLWLLPDTLHTELQQLQGANALPLALHTGYPDQGQGHASQTTDVSYYQWATMLPLDIRPVASAGEEGHVYEVTGLEKTSRLCLERLLSAQPGSDSLHLYLLYPSNTTDKQRGGVESDPGPSETPPHIRLFRTNLFSVDAEPSTLPGLLLTLTRDSFAPQVYFSQKQQEYPQDPAPWPFRLSAQPLYTDSVGTSRRAAVILYKDTSQSYGGTAWTPTDASVERPVRAYKVTFWAVAKPAQGTDPIQIEFQAGGVKEVKTVTDQWTQYTIILTEKYSLKEPVFAWAYLPEQNHRDGRLFTLAIGTADDAIQYWDSAVETLPAPPREYASGARLTEPRLFLDMMREHSIAASGGCYLSYQTEANPHGLPAYLWRTGQGVRLSLLILSEQGDEARAWHNALLTKGRMNTQEVVFFAETTQFHEHALTLLPGQTGFETLQQRPVPAPAEPVNPQPQFTMLHNLNVSGYFPGVIDPEGSSTISDPWGNPDGSKYQEQLAWIVETTDIAAVFWRTDLQQGAGAMRAALQDAAIIAFRAIGSTGTEEIKVLLKLDSRDGDEYASEALRLSTTWQRYEVPLAALNLPADWRQRVVYPFGFEVQNASPDAPPIRFAIDYDFGIQYGKQTAEVPIPDTSLAEIYHLLGYRIAGNSDFPPSVEGLPVGPSKPPADSGMDEEAFYYRQVLTVPVPQNPTEHSATLGHLLPPPSDPYRAVGRTLQLEFALHDIYGNRLPLANRNLSLPQYYFDALMPLTQWPNLTAAYRFTGTPTAPQLQILLDFAVRPYMPQANQPLSGQVQRMAADRRQYGQIYHQVAQADVSLRLSTTIGDLPAQPEKVQILDFLQQIYDYLATVEYLTATKYVQPLQPAQYPLQLQAPTPVPARLALYTVPADRMSLQDIAMHPEQAMDLFFANVDVLDILGPLPDLLPWALRDHETLRSLYEYAAQSDATLSIVAFAEQMQALPLLRKGATLFLPPASLSLSLAVTPQYAQTYGDQIFPLRVTWTIQRDSTHLHPQVCQEGMAAVRARVERAVTPVVPQIASGPDQAPLSLRSFAGDFEATFPLKVAVGPAATRSDSPHGVAPQGPGRGQLWAVPLGHAISVTPQAQKERYFAPRPLANRLLSRQAVPMQVYRSAQGLQAADPIDLQGVDLDDWGQQCLEAIDRFLAPDKAVAAQAVDPTVYQQLLQAKHRLAEAIADNVGLVVQRADNDRLPQRRAAARAVLRTHLERSLSNAYTIDALVQQQIVTTSPYTEATSAPYLIGQPTGQSYTIGTDENRSVRAIAQQLLPEVEQVSPTRAVTYVASVLAQVQGIFTPGSVITVDGATYTTQVGDSLQTAAEAVCASAREPLVALITAIADQPLLQSGKVLDLVRLTYPDTAPASLSAVADYFQVALVELMLANSDARLQAGQQLTETYTTQEDDTVATLLDHLADVLTQLPAAVSDNAALLQSVAGLRVLQLQSGYALSSASLDLTAGTSYLTYVVNQSGETNRRLLLPLDYAIRGLQYDRVPVTDMPGYYDRQWLNFVIPQAINLGTLEIPLPLRAYPTPLTLVGQEARTATPTQELTLDEAKTWAYRYTYTQEEKAQDAIIASLAWNVTDEQQGLQTASLTSGLQGTSTAASLSATVDADLLTALAQFTHIYPQMADDLEALALFDPATAPTDAHRSVVQAFTQLVSGVAKAWAGWNEARYTATQGTGRADFSCTIREFIDPTDHSLNIHLTPLAGRLPGVFAFPLVVADARYWQPPEPTEPPRHPTVDGADELDSVTYRFRLQPDVTLPIKDKQQRSLEVPGLNILQIQSARGGLTLSRNQDLLPGCTTHPDFVYQTPYLSFTNKLTPLLTLDQALDIASIGTPAPQYQDTLVRHLSRLFQHLLELGPEASNNQPYRLKLACRYVYSLTDGAQTALATTVPILLQPAFTFQLTDWEITPRVLGKPSFVERLAARIQRWQAEHQPRQQGGAYVFDLSLFSSPSEESRLLNFLATNTTYNLPGATSRTGMPLSFYIPQDYWQRGPNTQHAPYTMDNYTERVLAHYGADIYDVSTMQIASGLYPDFSLGMIVAKQWTQRLLRSFSGTLQSIRGWSYYLLTAEVLQTLDEETAKLLQPHTNARFDTTAEFRKFLQDMDIQDEQTVTQLVAAAEKPTFAYGGTTFFHRQDWRPQENTKPGAYFFRLIADQWFFTDPLTGDPEWPNQVMVNNDRKITWTDWKPITGENAWAGLVGPLQLAYLEHGGMPPYDSDGVQLALQVIPAYDAMQYKATDGRRGAVYYAPLNTAANQAGKFVDPQGVSNENIFSSYAGLTMLMEILAAAAARETEAQKQQRILADFTQVKTIATGIQDYLRHELYYAAGGHFYTGGSYSTAEHTGEQPGDFVTSGTSSPFRGGHPGGNLYPFAGDVHTWGCSVLGADRIDDWFGDGTAYKVWQQVKDKAGYYANGDKNAAILGVGYTDVPDPTTPEGQATLQGAMPHAFIISAEWSFGAIVMCQVLAEQYRLRAQRQADDRERKQRYLRYANALERDADSMIKGVRYILLDTSRDDQDIYAYYYANRRYAIPFGWYSNRVDSLCATAWALLVRRRFNPFVLGGSYQRSVIDPETYTMDHTPWSDGTGLRPFDPLQAMGKAGIPREQQKLLHFLVVNNTHNLDNPDSQSRTGMPLSFYAPPGYWENLPGYDQDNRHPTDPEIDNEDAVVERALIHYGVNIYDAATMQIAFAIFPQFKAGMEIASAQTRRLLSGFAMPNTTFIEHKLTRNPGSTIRGWTNLDMLPEQQFYYGKDKRALFPPQGHNSGPGAYFFRSIVDQYVLTDPLTNKATYRGRDSETGKVKDQPIVWVDWKPITGENAWAAMIGPLQLAYSTYGGMPPLESDGVRLALTILPAYEAMEAPDGGLFYAPWNMAGNIAGTQADALSLSHENNFSSYAGLVMLREVLMAAGDTTHLPLVEHLIAGTEHHFATHLYDARNNIFITSGTYNNPLGKFVQGGWLFSLTGDDVAHVQQGDVVALRTVFASHGHTLSADLDALTLEPLQPGLEWQVHDRGTRQSYHLIYDEPLTQDEQGHYVKIPEGGYQRTKTVHVYGEAFAVDVQTWGSTVLGVDKIDTWFGTNRYPELTAYAIWQTTKQRAGYFRHGDPNDDIWGVGYTDVPSAAEIPPEEKPHAFIISTEWTLGAINNCLVLAAQYDDPTSPHHNPAFAASLRKDADTMLTGINTVLLDKTSRSQDTTAYYYANRRYRIPFGWYANRIDSLCSNAWAIMVANRFNPFVLGGSYTAHPAPPRRAQIGQGSQPLLHLRHLRLRLEDIAAG
jgi:LysM repeat protein